MAFHVIYPTGYKPEEAPAKIVEHKIIEVERMKTPTALEVMALWAWRGVAMLLLIWIATGTAHCQVTFAQIQAMYNSGTQTFTSGHWVPLQTNVNGYLQVVCMASTCSGGGGGGSNAAAGPTGQPVPASASYTGLLDTATGNLVGQTADNILFGTAVAAEVVTVDQTGTPNQAGAPLYNFPSAFWVNGSSWNSSTPQNTTITLVTTGYGAEAITVSHLPPGTLSGGAITFEYSMDGGVTAATMPADAILDPTSTTFAPIAIPYTLVASTRKTFLVKTKGFPFVQMKLSTAITGAGNTAITYSTLPYSPNPIVTALSPTAANFLVTASQGGAPWTVTGTGSAGSAASGVLTVQGIASMTKLLVTPDANSSVNLSQINGTTTLTGNGTAGAGAQRVTIASDNTAFTVNSAQSGTWSVGGLGTAGSPTGGVLTVQGVASMTKLLVTPDSVALPANQSVNVNQLAGTTTDTNSGNKSAGTLRVVIATDQPQLTNKLLVTPDANSAINLAQVGGNSTNTGNGTSGTGTLRVAIASDNTANSNPFLVQPVPGTANGMSLYNVEPTASDNHAVIKNGAALFYHLQATNKGSANLYLRLYNAGTGFNGCNSATNLVYSAIIPNATGNGAGIVDDYPMGITFGTGISICVTGAYGQSDTTSATASIGEINIAYK